MIIWFSGTGNSRLVAEKLSELLHDDRLVRITDRTDLLQPLLPGERVVWVFPIYSWGVPPVVRDYIKNCDLDGDANHFMVCTCGDDCGLAYGMWRNDIRRRGWTARGGFSVQMPNTYVSLPGFDVDPENVIRRKLGELPGAVSAAARAISVNSNVDATVRGSFAWVKTRVIYPFFMRFLMSPKPFRYTDACVVCGKCSKVCPMHNICMKDNGPEWGKDCAMCLGCYHICPQRAVQYGKATDGKGQYAGPKDTASFV